MELQDASTGGEDDEPLTLIEVDVAAVAFPAAVDLIVLFLQMVEEHPMSPADVVVGLLEDGNIRLIAPDYLAISLADVSSLSTWAGPLPLRPAQIPSELLDLAGLISSLWSREGSPELPSLSQLFASIGVPISRDGRA